MVALQPSLTQHVVAYAPGEPVHAAAFLDGTPAIAREDGSITLGPPDAARALVAHPDGAVLTAAVTRRALVTGGDDGLVVMTRGDGSTETLHDGKGKWIDALAAREDGAVAFATGKRVFARDAKGAIKETAVPTTARGPRLRAEGLSAGDRPLQRREPVVSQRRLAARAARLEGLASRHDVLA